MRRLDRKVNAYVACAIVLVFGSGATVAIMRAIEVAYAVVP